MPENEDTFCGTAAYLCRALGVTLASLLAQNRLLIQYVDLDHFVIKTGDFTYTFLDGFCPADRLKIRKYITELRLNNTPVTHNKDHLRPLKTTKFGWSYEGC